MNQLEAETLRAHIARLMPQENLRVTPDMGRPGEYVIRGQEIMSIRYPWQFVLELLANILAGQQANGPRHDTK